MFSCLLLTSEVSVLLYDNCKEFFWYIIVLGFLKFLLKTCDVILNFVTTFYIRNIKDEHIIMSQATNEEAGFSSQQHFKLLRYLMCHVFHCIKTLRKHYGLKLNLN